MHVGNPFPAEFSCYSGKTQGVPGSWILNEWCDIEEMVTDVTSVKNNFMMWLCVCSQPFVLFAGLAGLEVRYQYAQW